MEVDTTRLTKAVRHPSTTFIISLTVATIGTTVTSTARECMSTAAMGQQAGIIKRRIILIIITPQVTVRTATIMRTGTASITRKDIEPRSEQGDVVIFDES